MDTKTLLIAALAVSLTTSLCMAIVFWTRQTYSGFGYWVAGQVCVTLSIPLFMLPRDHFSPWLTIILANDLWFAAMMLNNRGNLVFRSRCIGYGWEIAASVSFCALFAYFTVLEPNITARLTVIALYHGGFQLWTIAVLLMRRPAYFGSSDVLQVVSLGSLLAINIMRAGSLWVSGGSIPHQVIALQPFIDMILLGTIVIMLVLTLSQIIMNTQRLEYDYRIAQERLELALDGSNTGLYAAHLLTGETFVDERHQRLLGYRPGEVVFAVQNWLEHIHPQDQPALLERYEEVAKGSQPAFESEYRVRHRDGTWRWVLDRGKSFDLDALGCPRQVTGTLMDITERKQMEAALRESNARYDELVRRIPVGIYTLRIHASGAINFEYVSGKFCQMLGLNESEVLRDVEAVHGRIHPDDRATLDEANQIAAQNLKPFRWEGRSRLWGETRWIRLESEPTLLPNGDSLWNGVMIDNTERHRLEEALREQTIRDPLTGLFNRRYLDETLPRELHRRQRRGEPLAVAMLDVDHFKCFNDNYGHKAGDAVLRAIGELLKHLLRADDVACRYGGEELTVILPGATPDDAQVKLNTVRRAIMAMRVLYQGETLPAITVSVGVAAAGEQETDGAALLGRADAALYLAKEQGRNRVIASGA